MNSELITKFFLLIMCSFLLILYLFKTAVLSTKKSEKQEDVFYTKEKGALSNFGLLQKITFSSIFSLRKNSALLCHYW